MGKSRLKKKQDDDEVVSQKSGNMRTFKPKKRERFNEDNEYKVGAGVH